MQIEPFELERWQSVWENKVELNISESGVHPLTTAELVPDVEQLRKILDVQQLYPQTNGSEELRSLIAALYPGATAENVLVTCGGSEANFVSTWALLEPGDEVVFMMPNYMQIAGVARAMGATVKPLWLREALDWGINVDDLPRVVTPKTKLIAICNPSNPTGAVLRDDMRAAVVAAAAKVGAWIISDEVYRGAEFDGEMTETMWGGYERMLCTAGLSKAFSLPGLRTGWVVGAPKTIEKLWSYHDYTSIG
ncbi:MAG: aminotransferase class I/II-fold pyridoxal phosphate-dependent enzyme, partial [Candidatus Acidiferrales bacterium]